MKISAVIITYNEEKNIERCLQSLQAIADEIIVIDSFSTDLTESICKSFGATFIQHIFYGHIEQKNFAAKQAQYDYVLSLDADETLDETLQQEILSLKKKLIVADAYSMNRLTNYCGKWIKHSGWYPDTKTRLWNKEKGMWGGMNPHDKILMQKNSSNVFLKGNILHYSYYTIAEHYIQANKFATIAAHAYYNNGKKSSYLHIAISPLLKFIRNYFLKKGFLDGYYGFTICKITALETLWKYERLLKIQQEKVN
jgi:glycosyltransferase involved in cell wall biosynthesis